MAKGGRPKKDDGEQGTRQVRVFDDIAEMLADLSLVHPKSTAQILDPLIRPEVEELHRKFKHLIDEARATEAARVAENKRLRDAAAKLVTEPKPTRKKSG